MTFSFNRLIAEHTLSLLQPAQHEDKNPNAEELLFFSEDHSSFISDTGSDRGHQRVAEPQGGRASLLPPKNHFCQEDGKIASSSIPQPGEKPPPGDLPQPGDVPGPGDV